jgi:hypothetical protein
MRAGAHDLQRLQLLAWYSAGRERLSLSTPQSRKVVEKLFFCELKFSDN